MWVDQRGSEIISLNECLRLLAMAAKRGAVGRLAVSRQEAPLIQPVNFAYRDRRVLVRLGSGAMESAAIGGLVAFEVDDLDREAGRAWSVLVRGLAVALDEPERLGDAHVAPVPLVPSPGDTMLAIRLDVVTGRRFRLHPPSAQGARPEGGAAAAHEGDGPASGSAQGTAVRARS
ncbi:MAG: pyridoxamine 5'-phosphate oxidase family protein [Acidimicrobiales bacterium]|jgi:hypothetical protein